MIIKNYKKDSLDLTELENKIVCFCNQVSFATIVENTNLSKGINDVLKRSGTGNVCVRCIANVCRIAQKEMPQNAKLIQKNTS